LYKNNIKYLKNFFLRYTFIKDDKLIAKINDKIKFKLYTNVLEGIVKKIIDPLEDDIYDSKLYQVIITKKLDDFENLLNVDTFLKSKELINVNEFEIIEVII